MNQQAFEAAARTTTEIEVARERVRRLLEKTALQNGYGIYAERPAVLRDLQEAYNHLGVAVEALLRGPWPSASDYSQAAERSRQRAAAGGRR